MKYQFTFGKNSLIVWALILPAFLLLIPLLLILTYCNSIFKQFEWFSVVLSLTYFACTFWLTFKFLKLVTTNAEIELEHNKIVVHFPKKNIFHRSDFSLDFNDITNLSEDNDKAFDFMHFETSLTLHKKFHFSTKEGNPDFQNFKNQLYAMELVNQTSSPNSLKPLTHITVYQKWPMKLLALILVLAYFIFPLVASLNSVSWFYEIKYWFVVLIGLPIIYKVYAQNWGNQKH
jgi:hypothetical protein